MLIRIVKMTFQEARTADFKEFVKTIGDTIRAFDGCEHLDILQDIHHPNIFFSYSWWTSEKNLNHYRNSDFFKGTWSKVRRWFDSKPEAWSVEKL